MLLDHIALCNLAQFNGNCNVNGRILDLILSDKPTLTVSLSEPLSKIDRHHAPLLIRAYVHDNVFLEINEDGMTRFNFYKADFSSCNESLASIDWISTLNKFDCNSSVTILYDILSSVISLNVSEKTKKNARYPTWFSRSLINCMNEKEKFHQKFKKYGNPRDYESFSILRKRSKKMLRTCRNFYISNIELNISNNVRNFWAYVKSKKDLNSLPKVMQHHNQTAECGEDICELLSAYFCSVFDPVHINSASAPTVNAISQSAYTVPMLRVSLDKLALALKWVQKNISAFGGDSTNVTLCGLSSGCSLIEMHMLSPLTRGLFHKVIMSSSSSLHHWSFSYDPIGSAFRVGKQLGFNGDGRKELLEFFETVESETLLREIDKLKMKKLSNRGATDYSFAPVVEKEFKNVKSFLTRDPFDVIKSGDFPKLPYLSGIGNREGLMLAIIAKNRLRNAYETRDLMQYLPYEIKETDLHSIKPRIDEIYTSKFHPGDEFSEYLLHYFGDCEYASGVLLSTKFIAKYNPQVYLYYFTYSGNFNYVKNLMQVPHLDGATHCDEQGYLFSNNFTKAKCDPTDILVRDRMVQMWTSFMRTGNPTPKLTPLINEIWEPLDPERMNCLNIGEDFRMENNVLGKRRIFWEDMFLKSKKYGVERKDEIDQPRYEITKL